MPEATRTAADDGESARAPQGRQWPALPGGVRVELATAEPPPGRSAADLVEPFVPLGRRGRFSRTLLARVVGPGGEAVREVALKMQSDEYPLGELAGWSNPDVDQRWTEQARRWRLAAAAGAAPALVDVLPEGPESGSALLPPTIYCKLRRAYFPAPCPQCGARLETCRDDGWLETHGLPRYDTSLERFLFCPGCRAAGAAPQFYALILPDPRLRQRAPVAEQTELFQAFGALARRGGPLPCAGCEEVPSCYPEGRGGEALHRLTPVSFYDFRCVAMERLDIHYDELAAVAGGAPLPGGGRPAVRRYLFEDDPRGKLPLEILRLKLALFAQVVAAASALLRTTRAPHLAIAPENVMASLAAAPVGLPSLYGFRTLLLGIGAAQPRRLGGLNVSGLTVAPLEAPPLRDDTYAAPLVTAATGVHGAGFAITNVAEAGEGQLVLEGELASDAFDVRTLAPKDVVHATVRQGRPVPLALEFLANPVARGTRHVRLHSTPITADAGLAGQLRALVGQEPVRATVAIHPCLHAPCDVYSLGMLLFTTLTANREQLPPDIAAEARELAARMSTWAGDHPNAGADDLQAAALALVHEAEGAGWLARRQLFHQPPDAETFDGRVLGGYWGAALVLALRALTQTAGFGFCRGHDDFDPVHPEGPLDHLLGELRILMHRIDGELLGMQGRRRDMAAAVARVRGRLEGSGAPRAGR